MPLTSRELWWDGSNALNCVWYTEWTDSILTPWSKRWNKTTGVGRVYRDQAFQLTGSWDHDTLTLPAKDKSMNYVWTVHCDHVSVKDLSSDAKNNMKFWIIYIELNFHLSLCLCSSSTYVSARCAQVLAAHMCKRWSEATRALIADSKFPYDFFTVIHIIWIIIIIIIILNHNTYFIRKN